MSPATTMTTRRVVGSGSDAIRDISGYLVESSPLAVLSKRCRRAPLNTATLPCVSFSSIVETSSDTGILIRGGGKERERGMFFLAANTFF